MTYRVISKPNSKKTDYTPRGGCKEFIYSREPEVIAVGPADTGKTMAACWKIHLLAMKYAGMNASIIRATQKSLYGSVIQTYQRIVEGAPVDAYGGEKPDKFMYQNGSVVWLGGMDNADKVLSTERDITYVNQAEELALDAWEKLSTRTSGRGAVMPYTQLLGDANPAGSKHWILERSKNGKLRLIKTTHKDNPTIYNEDGTLTENGARRLEALNNLSGVRRKRLFLGEWATAEGAVYDMFDPEIHVVERDPKEFKDFGLAIDWGYVHPSVILLFGIDGDDRLHIIREFYKTGQLQETVVKTAREWFFNPCTSDDPDFHPKCTMIVVDEHASGLIADLRNNSLPAMPAGGKITHGIASIQNRLKIQGDGKPRITVDPSCVNTINEFESWEWKPGKDEPLDIGDDAMDCVRYFDSAFAPVQLFF